jgi:hypothetical protein
LAIDAADLIINAVKTSSSQDLFFINGSFHIGPKELAASEGEIKELGAK